MSRVLLCLGDAEIRQGLAAMLVPQHECLQLPPTGALENLSFDLVLTDEAQFQLHPQLLLRDDTAGTQPAVLLILSPACNSRERSALIDAADDFVFNPVQPLELSARVERLMRTRRAQLATPKAEATEAGLRKAEARLAEIQALAHAGHWELQLDTDLLWWSNELCRLFGRDPAQAPTSKAEFLELVDPVDRAKCSEAFFVAMDNHGARSVEFHVSTRGESKTFLGSAQLHVDRVSGSRSLQGVIVDVTEARWRALRDIVATEMTELLVRDRPVREFAERGAANFLRLFPNLACATAFTDAQSGASGVIASSNVPEDQRRFLEKLVYCEGLLQATSQSNGLVIVEDIETEPRCAQLQSEARALGLRSCWFVPLVDTQHRAFGCFVVSSPRLGTPEAEALAMSVRGARLTSIVVERTRSLTLLRESEARLRALFDHAPLGVCLADREGNAFYANPALYALVGTPTHEPSMEWSKRVHPEDRTRVLENWQQLAQGQIASVDTMCRFLTTTGEVRTVRALANTVRQGEAQRGVVATLEDVTERLSLEDQLRQSQKMEAMGRLAGGIAHDFNNLLAVMLNGLEALERIAAQGERELLQPLVETCERAAALTQQLLAFSRRQPIQRKTEDLRMIVGGVSTLLQSLLGQQITLVTDPGSRAAPAYVNANMIEQVLMNLVINARDVTPQGGKVVLRLEPSIDSQQLRDVGRRPGATFHRITVSDTGTGIAKDDLARIFEPFFTTKAEGKGTGLGLAIAFGVVQQHGGWLEVESELGQGTSFHVYLPSAPEQSEPAK